MPSRIYIQSAIPDARSGVKKDYFNSLGLRIRVKSVSLADCYVIDKELNGEQLKKAGQLLANPLTETAAEKLCAPENFHLAVEIGFLPGVTDNVGGTARETLDDGLKIKFAPAENVYSSRVFFIAFEKKPGAEDMEKIKMSLFNPLIERAAVKLSVDFKKDGGMDLVIPKVKLEAKAEVVEVNLELSDRELEALGKLGIENKDGTRRGPLSLSLDYLKAIKKYFDEQGRKPTDVELETLAQTWSEHCKHTIFADPMDELERGIYKTYIKGATEAIRKKKGKKDFCVSVFTDNSGAIAFDENYLITHKVETHNTPSALDPFGGSVTGIVGVNRDCLGFGLGAKPVINVYGFCLADPEDGTELFRDKEKKQKMLSARRIMEGVVAGINAGGNQSGIPTNLGFIYFDPRFRGKPLVFAGTVGIIPRQIKGRSSHIKKSKPGDLIVTAGGRIGADGIHGATFSSESLDTHSPATAVQIGDPITQKKMSDALVKEARDLGLYSSITDCGAGGLSSAVGEMAEATGGCIVNLEKAPLKYPGLAPWQIWISESQERMVLSVPEKNWPALRSLLENRGVEAAVIGKFTDSGKASVEFGEETVLDLEMDFLHNGRPIKSQTTKKPDDLVTQNLALTQWKKIEGARTQPLLKKDYSKDILNLISKLNICGFEFITRQYDHEVQAGSVLKPLAGRGRINAQATVTRPVLSSKKGVVLSSDLYPALSELDPYKMAATSIDGAIRAAVATGADIDNLALLDNFCWSSSDDPERLWQLKEAARACYDFATAYGAPFISGKDSMFNDFKGFSADGKPIKISIPPTLLISAIGVIPDAYRAISLDAKAAGDYIYVLGDTDGGMGGSEYLAMLGLGLDPGLAEKIGKVPGVDPNKNYQLYKLFYQAVQKNLIASAISISRGGLASALVKTLAGGGFGGDVSLKELPGNWKENYQALFSESNGRILATVDKKKAAEFEKAMVNTTCFRIGRVGKNSDIKISDKKNKIISRITAVGALKAYKNPLKDF
ncbi:MAG: AIR synthase-related protein [Patescibacteria group bacterium]|jgi:phosphoribosylformylglycinamidine synthase